MPDGGKDASQVSELATLFPAPRTFTIGGRELQIAPCTLRQAGRVLDLGLPLWATLREGDDPYTLLEERPDETAALIVAAIDCDPAWAAALPAIDRAELVTAWLEVNAGFFFRRLVPMRARSGKALRAALGAGPTSSHT